MDESSSPVGSGINPPSEKSDIPPFPEASVTTPKTSQLNIPEPTQYVNKEVLGRNFQQYKKFIIVLFATILLGIPAFLLQIKSPSSKLSSTTTESSAGFKKELDKKTKELLTAPLDRDVATYLAMATEEKNYDASYDHYVKAYNALKIRYALSQDPKYYILLSELRDHIAIYPQYKESDLK